MNYATQQKRLDDAKWYDSIRAGADQCGSYPFCTRCKKQESYPCARAAHWYENGYIRVATVVRHKKA